METSKDKFPRGQRRGVDREKHLGSVWRAFKEGRGVSKDDAGLVLADLAEFTEFYFTAGDDVTPEQLLRREGRRDVMGRILFLLNFDMSFIQELQSAALDELQTTQDEARYEH
jgi:hypothetical protein